MRPPNIVGRFFDLTLALEALFVLCEIFGWSVQPSADLGLGADSTVVFESSPITKAKEPFLNISRRQTEEGDCAKQRLILESYSSYETKAKCA